MEKEIEKINGELVLEKIKVCQIAEKKVIKNSDTGGKIVVRGRVHPES